MSEEEIVVEGEEIEEVETTVEGEDTNDGAVAEDHEEPEVGDLAGEIDGTSDLNEEQSNIVDNLMEGAEVSQDPVDTADYDRMLKSCQDAEQMTCLPAWQAMYADIVQCISTAKAKLVDCKGSEVKTYQEAIKAYKYLIMKQVDKAEILNSYIKNHPLFVIAESDKLIGADFDFETGKLTTSSISNKAKGRKKLIGSFDFPLY